MDGVFVCFMWRGEKRLEGQFFTSTPSLKK